MKIIGRLTRDAEVRNLQNEKNSPFLNYYEDNYRNKQGERIEQITLFQKN